MDTLSTPGRLNRADIERAMQTRSPVVVTLELADTVGSTNDLLMQRAGRERVHAVALLAEQQTAGRGRSGRAWLSPPTGNLYLSLGWTLEGLPMTALAGLSLAVGVAVTEAVDTCCGVALGLKWPNDILHSRGKVGGILIDTAAAGNGGICVVIGVGLNLQMSAEGAAAIDQPWVDVATLAGGACHRDQLAGDLIARLVELLQDWPVSGFAAWRGAWQSRDMLRGRQVTLEGAGRISGVASGVAEDGSLLVATREGLRAVHSGEARLLKREDADS